ncbi:MAG: SAM-dependent methyltransferase [Planctomycetes bacterium]|nr:SAM-dependent methyltransferase [Planctomycetota bacterium]
MLNKLEIRNILNDSSDLIKYIGMQGKDGFLKKGMEKKFNEIVGFSEKILTVVKKFQKKKEIVFLECSCGKSYLSFVLNYILSFKLRIRAVFYGVDTNEELIRKCDEACRVLGFSNMNFRTAKTIDFELDSQVDIVIALHACDTATDEAIVKGIKLDAQQIMVVPCCQGQVRSQIKKEHPLSSITQFGLLRYKFANILTDALRAQFLLGSGYFVELFEIVSPRLSPKNILISARKIKNKHNRNLNEYFELSSMFNTHFGLEDMILDSGMKDSLLKTN